MDAPVVIGVDIGTTSAKATAVAPDGERREGGEVGYELREPEPGWAVQDPGAVLDATLEAVRAAVAAVRRAGGQVAGLALSSAMHSLVALDGHDRPLTDLVTWADTRAAPQAERLRGEHPELHDRTGTPLHPMSPLTKLVWFAERAPEIVAAARRWAGIKELVVHRLCGVWAIDHSCASGTGLLELSTLRWDPEALALAGVDAGALSRPVPTTEALALDARGAEALGLSAGTPVVVGAGDGPLANLGVGAVRPGVVACSIGTSGALRLVVERPAVDPGRHLFCYALTPGRWVVGGAINNGGVVLEWTHDALAPELGDPAEPELMRLAGTVPAGSEGLLMLPHLLSERAPHWTANAHGAYVGLTLAHRRAHLVRAAIEGVCLQLALVLASMRDAGNAVAEIRATGGFARSELWRRMLAGALDAPIGFPAGHQGSGFGAALLGLEALGLIDSIELAGELVRIDAVVEPDADDADAYAALLPTFAALHDALGPAFAALSQPAGRASDARSPRHT